jgi:hypothetical protein
VSLQRQLDRQLEEKNGLLRQRDLELGKNRELTGSLYDVEAKNKVKEDQLLQTRKEMDEVRFSNNSMIDRNGDLRGEIEAL